MKEMHKTLKTTTPPAKRDHKTHIPYLNVITKQTYPQKIPPHSLTYRSHLLVIALVIALLLQLYPRLTIGQLYLL